MLSRIKSYVPVGVKKPVIALRKSLRYGLRHRRFKQAARNDDNLRIIVGAAETFQKNWYSTNQQWLDITQPSDWHKLFKGRSPLTHVVAEHVFEHLTPEGAAVALQQCYQHLKPGGRVRIAVPDGFHPDPTYLKHVGIKGIGPDAADHKQLYSVTSLSQQLQAAGFQAQHVEGYDASGTLVQNLVDDDNGFIKRSRQNRDEVDRLGWDFVDASTSLIVDGIK